MSPSPLVRPFGPCLCLLAVLAGCARPAATATAVPALEPAAPPAVVPPGPVWAEGAAVPVAELVRLARSHASTAGAVAALQAAARAEARQAGAWSNPELELRTGRVRSRSGETPSERTWGAELRQRFELPGKRAARLAAAAAGGAVAEHEAGLLWLDLEGEVRAAAAAYATAQAAQAAAREAAGLAAELHRAAAIRAGAGELARADLARARLDEALAGIAAARSGREAESALQLLRLWCGAGLPAAFTIPDALPASPPAIALDDAVRLARERHPRLRRLAAEAGLRAAEARREERAWLPDLTVGVSRDRAGDEDEVGVSLGFDLPLWSRGDGDLAAAAARRAQAEAALRGETGAIEREVVAAWHAYESARQDLSALSAEAGPLAAEAVRLRQAAFAAGGDALADVLEARRAAQAVAEAGLAARRAAADAAIALGRAVGSFATLDASGSQP